MSKCLSVFPPIGKLRMLSRICGVAAFVFVAFAGSHLYGGVLLNYDPFYGSSNSPGTGATATVLFEFTDNAPPPGRSTVQLTITNTTDGTGSFDPGTTTLGATAATLMGFGFDAPTGVTFVTGSFVPASPEFNFLQLDVTLPPFGSVEIAISKNQNFIGGNPNGGLLAGESVVVLLDLDTDPALNAAELEAAFLAGFSDSSLGSFARFQQVDPGGSDKIGGGIPGVTPPPPPFTDVPEPASLAIFGLFALCSAGAGVRRRRLQRQ